MPKREIRKLDPAHVLDVANAISTLLCVVVWQGLCHRNLFLAAGTPEAEVRSQAAVDPRRVRKASSRKTRSVRRDVRWRWTLKLFWTAA